MSNLVDLTETDDEIDADHGQPAVPVPNNAGNQQIQLSVVRLKVDMCPIAKPSVRFGPGRGGPNGMYRRYIDTAVTNKMAELRSYCVLARDAQGVQIIPRNVPVVVKAWFFLKRPTEDFISRRRVAGRLREEALQEANTIVPVKPDVDNCGKFLLDSLTGALFEDDAQVVALQMYKLRDNDGLCNGRMQIECSSCYQSLNSLLPNW